MARKAAVGGRINYKKVTSQTVHENNKVIKTTNSYFCWRFCLYQRPSLEEEAGSSSSGSWHNKN